MCRFEQRTLSWVILIFLSFVTLASAVTYPLHWRWSNPRPHGGNVVDMGYWSAQGAAVQVAERGQLFSSSDLSFWVPIDCGVSNDLRAVGFFGNRLLITGENGTALYADTLTDVRSGALDLPTTDWLEAVTASPTLAVAVGDNAAVYTSVDGINWRRQNAGTSAWLIGVTWDSSGGFVAVGENGAIIGSLDGTNWTARSSGTSRNLNRVAFLANRYTAVGDRGVCISSLNGTNWFPESIGATNDLFHSTAATGARLAVGDGEVRLQTTDGGWSDELAKSNGPVNWTYFASLPRSLPYPYFLIAGHSGLMCEGIRTNTNPFAWSSIDDSIRNWLWDVTYATNLYVAVGDRATVMTSGTGVDWHLELVPAAVTNSIFLGVGANANMLVTVGSAGSMIISPNIVSNYTQTNLVGTNIVVTNITSSAFGVLWYAINSQTTNDLQGIAARLDLFVATGAYGTIITSPDGTNWTLQVPPTDRFLSSVTPWPRGWIATGDDGVIVSSNDGKTWNVVSAPNGLTTNWLYRVRYLGGRLIAVGQNGTIATSTNGTSWTRFSSSVTGTTKWLNDVAYIDDTYFVIGNFGTVLVSTNAVNWTSIGTVTRKNLYAAATDSDQLIAAGVEGVILRAQIVPDTNAPSVLAYQHVTTTGPSGPVYQNVYLFGGRTDQQFSIDHRAAFDTNSWTAGAELEFFDGSGTLYYLETLTSTNPPPTEFYRATLLIP